MSTTVDGGWQAATCTSSIFNTSIIIWNVLVSPAHLYVCCVCVRTCARALCSGILPLPTMSALGCRWQSTAVCVCVCLPALFPSFFIFQFHFFFFQKRFQQTKVSLWPDWTVNARILWKFNRQQSIDFPLFAIVEILNRKRAQKTKTFNSYLWVCHVLAQQPNSQQSQHIHHTHSFVQ